MEKDPGSGGCLHVQPMTEPFPTDMPETIASLLEELIGKSDGHEDKIVYDSPLFPKFRSDYCEQARSKMQNYAYTVNSWQVAKPHLYNSEELMSGKYDIMESAVNGPGG